MWSQGLYYDEFFYSLRFDQIVRIDKYTGSARSLVIPAELGGNPVK